MIRYLPNVLTLCNLLCGVLGIVYTLKGNSVPAAGFIWVACVFDFFDGFVARLLKVQSPIGKELDSLADVVSFGVLPSMVLYEMLLASTTDAYLPWIAFVMAAFSALRLAIFNVDETQRDSFRGLPTPANALFISALPLLTGTAGDWVQQSGVLVMITLVFSFLLVSPIELFALKFKTFSWKENRMKFTFLALAVLLMAVFQHQAIPLVIILYILFSLAFKKYL